MAYSDAFPTHAVKPRVLGIMAPREFLDQELRDHRIVSWRVKQEMVLAEDKPGALWDRVLVLWDLGVSGRGKKMPGKNMELGSDRAGSSNISPEDPLLYSPLKGVAPLETKMVVVVQRRMGHKPQDNPELYLLSSLWDHSHMKCDHMHVCN